MKIKINMIRKIVFSLLFLIIVVLIFELSLRIYFKFKKSSDSLFLTGDERIYDYRPSFSYKNKYGVKVKQNSLGLIGNEIGNKDAQTIRILAIGDSVTAGLYLSQEERYINKIAETIFRKTGQKIEPLNAGVGGYNSWQEAEKLKIIAPLTKPDIAIIGVGLNDYVRARAKLYAGAFGRMYVNYRDGSKARHLNFLYQNSDLYKFIYDILSGRYRMMLSSDDYLEYLKNYKVSINNQEFREWSMILLVINDFCKKEDIRPIFVIFPLHGQVIKEEDKTCARLSEFFIQNNIDFIDLIDDFKKNKDKELFLRYDMIHPTSIGHEIAAEKISAYIITKGYL